jgi:hypothetical protein
VKLPEIHHCIWKTPVPEWVKNGIFPSGEGYTKENFLLGKVKSLEIYGCNWKNPVPG